MPRPGKGKPDYKNRNQGDSYNKDRNIPDYRAGWVSTKLIETGILLGPEEEGIEDEQRDVVLSFLTPGKLPNMYYNLSHLTEEELNAVKELFDTAFEWALPVVQRRDKDALDAIENGDDTVDRLYRPVPQLVFRKRKVGEHYESVQIRPAGISQGGRTRYEPAPDDRVRGAGDGVAEHDPNKDEAQDDTASTHQPEAVRQVGRVVKPPLRVHGSEGVEDYSAPDR